MTNPQATERGQALELLRRALDDPRVDFRDGQWEATAPGSPARVAISIWSGSGPVFPVALSTSGVGD